MKKQEMLTQLASDVHKNCPSAVFEVLTERMRQNKKFGDQNHDPYRWITILMEEVGELSQAVLQTEFGGDKGGAGNIHDEVIQVAAVALAMVECCKRKAWGIGPITTRHSYGAESLKGKNG